MRNSNINNISQRLKSDGFWVALGRFSGIGALVLVNVILARVLKPSQFGAFGLLSSVAYVASVVAMAGFNMGVVRLISESLAANDGSCIQRILHITRNSTLVTISASALIAFCLLYHFSTTISGGLEPIAIAFAMALCVIFLAYNNLLAAILRGLGEARLAIFLGPQHSGGPCGSIIFIGMILILWVLRTDASLELVLFLFAIAYALCLPIGVAWVKVALQRLSSRMQMVSGTSSVTATSALKLCLPLMLSQVLSIGTRDADLWIGGENGTTAELGFYVAARRVVQLVAVPIGFVNLTVIALIPELWAKRQITQLQFALQTAATHGAIVSFVCFLFILAAPALILHLLFGPAYEQAARMLSILAFGQLAFAWFGAAEMTLLMTGHSRLTVMVNAVSMMLLIVLGPFVTARWGMTGLAVFYSSIIAFQSAILWINARLFLGIWTNATWLRRTTSS